MKDITSFTFGVLLIIFLVSVMTLPIMVFGFVFMLPAGMSFAITSWLFPTVSLGTTPNDLHLFFIVHFFVCWLWATPGIIWMERSEAKHQRERMERRKKELEMERCDPSEQMADKPPRKGYQPSGWQGSEWS
jgi:hypothetical protein